MSLNKDEWYKIPNFTILETEKKFKKGWRPDEQFNSLPRSSLRFLLNKCAQPFVAMHRLAYWESMRIQELRQKVQPGITFIHVGFHIVK